MANILQRLKLLEAQLILRVNGPWLVALLRRISNCSSSHLFQLLDSVQILYIQDV